MVAFPRGRLTDTDMVTYPGVYANASMPRQDRISSIPLPSGSGSELRSLRLGRQRRHPGEQARAGEPISMQIV